MGNLVLLRSRIEIEPTGFDMPRIGKVILFDDKTIKLDMDPHNFLPPEFKYETISAKSKYKVL